MGKAHARGVESTAAVFHHPIHPMLIAFPVAALMAAPATDLAAKVTGDPFWTRASRWLLAAGLVSGAAASAVGLVDYLAIKQVRRLAAGNVHAAGNVLGLALAGWNLLRRADEEEVDDLGVGLSVATVAILGVTAWLGGELSYRHGVGVIAHDSPTVAGEGLRALRKAA